MGKVESKPVWPEATQNDWFSDFQTNQYFIQKNGTSNAISEKNFPIVKCSFAVKSILSEPFLSQKKISFC